jgi:hypothetical protein
LQLTNLKRGHVSLPGRILLSLPLDLFERLWREADASHSTLANVARIKLIRAMADEKAQSTRPISDDLANAA